MAAWQIFKVSRKTFFNPSEWLSVDEIRQGNRTIWNSVRDLFTVTTPERQETFDEAIKRMGLSNYNIEEARKNYFAFTWMFVFLGAITVIFAFYLLFFHGTFHGWFLGLAAAALFFLQAFRYSFWHFQIVNRKLGCTFQEWRSGKISNSKEKTP